MVTEVLPLMLLKSLCCFNVLLHFCNRTGNRSAQFVKFDFNFYQRNSSGNIKS